MEHGQGVVAVNVIGRALDVMGHTSIAYASHLHDSVYTHIVARAHANNGCCMVAMRMRMRCIAVQYDASFPSPKQRNPQPGPVECPALTLATEFSTTLNVPMR